MATSARRGDATGHGTRAAQRGPGLLAGDVDQRGAFELGGREDREEHQRLVAGVVGAVHRRPSGCARFRRDRAGATPCSTHCSAPPDIDVDDFLHRGMAMEGVALAGRHAHAHQQQIFRHRSGPDGTATRAAPTAPPRPASPAAVTKRSPWSLHRSLHGRRVVSYTSSHNSRLKRAGRGGPRAFHNRPGGPTWPSSATGGPMVDGDPTAAGCSPASASR